MASPLNMKFKWPSQKQQSSKSNLADFVPYVSNLVNAFRKPAKPMPPKLIDPVSGTRISMDDARRQVADQTQGANLATRDLDAQTGAAIRVGNMGNKFRALSDINSREAQMNAQLSNQTKYINANIASQNAAATNAYQDDIVNAQVAQTREQSANLANAADKFIAQQAVKDQIKLEKDKAIIMSKAYNKGVYDRLTNSLEQSGVNTSGFLNDTSNTSNVPQTLDINKYKSMVKPLAPTAPDLDLNTRLGEPSLVKMRKYMQNRTYATGGMMKVHSEDPVKPGPKKDAYYESSAALAYYKDQLNNKLKAKNPTAFGNYFKGLVDLRRTGKTTEASQYVQNADYNEYLSPDEVRSTLGDEGYNRYLSSLQTVNQYNVQQGLQPLYGNIEGENDITKLNYGRRFASLQITPSLSVTNTTRNTRYDRNYTYDPTKGIASYSESGDKTLKPDYLEKAAGGLIRKKSKYRNGGMFKPFY